MYEKPAVRDIEDLFLTEPRKRSALVPVIALAATMAFVAVLAAIAGASWEAGRDLMGWVLS